MIARYSEKFGGFFEPEDLKLLQKLFDGVCTERGYSPDSEDAERAALLIVNLFKSGIVDEIPLRRRWKTSRSQSL
jgi:hypothetical protein